jgi:hypothetical protein
MNKRLDLWSIISVNKIFSDINVVDNTVVLHVDKNDYLITVESVEEISIYKLDHMSFDTLILKVTTIEWDYEIPYGITFDSYKKIKDKYVIPKFDIDVMIQGFDNLINWIYANFKDIQKDWLDKNIPIVDDNNLMVIYKKA